MLNLIPLFCHIFKSIYNAGDYNLFHYVDNYVTSQFSLIQTSTSDYLRKLLLACDKIMIIIQSADKVLNTRLEHLQSLKDKVNRLHANINDLLENDDVRQKKKSLTVADNKNDVSLESLQAQLDEIMASYETNLPLMKEEMEEEVEWETVDQGGVDEEVLCEGDSEQEVIAPNPVSTVEQRVWNDVDFSNLGLLEDLTNLYNFMTNRSTHRLEILDAVIHFNFRDLQSHFKSINNFRVWLNVVLRSGFVGNATEWIHHWMPSWNTKKIKNFWNCFGKCRNKNILQFCITRGLYLNVCQRVSAERLEISTLKSARSTLPYPSPFCSPYF